MTNDDLPRRIVSGGQTGVDRAALDAAMERGTAVGGWCPRGRLAEDGRIDERYPLRETPSAENTQRTEWNVRDSDGTLVLVAGEPVGGTALTVELCLRLRKPCLIVDVGKSDAEAIRKWLRDEGIADLNVAGPRETEAPGIYEKARRLLASALA